MFTLLNNVVFWIGLATALALGVVLIWQWPRRTVAFIFKTIVLCVGTVGLLELIVAVVGQYPEVYYCKSYPWIDRLAKPPRLLFLGSSTVVSGVNPLEFARELQWSPGEAISLALDGMNPVHSYFAWRDISAKAKSNLETVIFGFDPWIFFEQYYRFEPLSYTRWNILQRFLILFDGGLMQSSYEFPAEKKKMILSYSYARESLVQMADNLIWKGCPVANDTTPDFGSAPRDPIPPNFGEPVEIDLDRADRLGLSDYYFSYLRKIKTEVEAEGKVFALLLPPKSANFVNGYRAKDNSARSIREALNRYLGPTRVIGSFEALSEQDQPAMMNDNVHLNRKGEMVFTRYISRQYATLRASRPQSIRNLTEY